MVDLPGGRHHGGSPFYGFGYGKGGCSQARHERKVQVIQPVQPYQGEIL